MEILTSNPTPERVMALRPSPKLQDRVSALRHEADLAGVRRAHFERICQAFEQRYWMSSEEFIQQFESGTLGDDAEYFDWYAAKRGLDLWERRFHILSGVRV
jgi:hypothetical protein